MKEGAVEIATEEVSETADKGSCAASVNVGGDSKEAADPCLLGCVVVHNRHKMSMSLVPPAVVGFRQTVTDDVRHNGERRKVQALPS